MPVLNLRNRGLKKLSILPKITQVVSDRARRSSEVFQYLCHICIGHVKVAFCVGTAVESKIKLCSMDYLSQTMSFWKVPALEITITFILKVPFPWISFDFYSIAISFHILFKYLEKKI